ncbi:MAG TPA: thioesterase family protein [Thermoanaerobaculia bacterium]|jgi:acyl-CoA thioesterase|nr:thioesterase family protein [Thermoanaerobaculia bacterium]
MTPELAVPGFAAAVSLTSFAGDRATAAIPPGWAQGRATFGGIVLGQALVAARRTLPEPRPCRSLVATFPAPIGVGEVDIRLRELRHGRAVSSVQVEVAQGGELGCVALVSFGGARPSAVDVPAPPPPPLPPPDELPLLLPLGAPGPEFTRFVDYRLAFGARPYAGADVRELGGWCRFPGERQVGEEHRLGLVDAWPSPAVSRFAAPAPAASMTWAIELLPIEPVPEPDGWWLYHAELESARDGYAHAAARLWSPAGRLAALSRQVVAIFG